MAGWLITAALVTAGWLVVWLTTTGLVLVPRRRRRHVR